MERAEAARSAADEELSVGTRRSSAGAADEANRIIDEARKTADQLRTDLQARAEQESHSIVARAQEESVRNATECSRSFGRRWARSPSSFAGKVVGESLDTSAHARLIDEYIDEVTSGNGKN